MNRHILLLTTTIVSAWLLAGPALAGGGCPPAPPEPPPPPEQPPEPKHKPDQTPDFPGAPAYEQGIRAPAGVDPDLWRYGHPENPTPRPGGRNIGACLFGCDAVLAPEPCSVQLTTGTVIHFNCEAAGWPAGS